MRAAVPGRQVQRSVAIGVLGAAGRGSRRGTDKGWKLGRRPGVAVHERASIGSVSVDGGWNAQKIGRRARGVAHPHGTVAPT